MKHHSKRILAAAVAAALVAPGALASPMMLSDAQMDGVAAGGAPTATGFVCPVIKTENVLHSVKGASPQEGLYTILGASVPVPAGATNTLDDGTAGSPGGDYAAPGDTGYTAIWYTGG